MFTIEVLNEKGDVLAQAQGDDDARLVYAEAWHEGDRIVFTSESAFAWVSVNQSIEPAFVYLPRKAFDFFIPFGDAKNGYASQAFTGVSHTAWIRAASDAEMAVRRNVARNPADQHMDTGCFPHAAANVETRGEAQFWARNAIDGHRFNDKHGSWPYHSWGIGERRDAWLKIDFGRPVRVDEIGIVLRADFPHDAWWERGTLACSDGFITELAFVKTAQVQRFPIGERVVEWVCLQDLIKANDPSPFPALTQIEVYGREVR